MPAKSRRNPTRNLVRDNKSGVWNARWCEGGRLRTKSLGTKDTAEARRLIAPFMARVAAERSGVVERAEERPRVAWEQVAAAYREDSETYPRNPRTAGRYEVDLRRVGGFLSECDVRPEEVTEQTVAAFVADRRLDELSTSSIKNALTAWNRAMSVAAYAGLTPQSAATFALPRLVPPSPFRRASNVAGEKRKLSSLLVSTAAWHLLRPSMKASGSPACSAGPAASVANRSAKADPATAAAGLAATSSNWQSSRSAFHARLAALRAASSA